MWYTALIFVIAVFITYIWCMKRAAPIQMNTECFATVIRTNENVVMYDVTIDHEIIGYFVGMKSEPPIDTMVEFTDREDAITFFDELVTRVWMVRRGICLN